MLDHAGPARARVALALLTAVSFFNYLDRMVLAVVLEPIKREMHLTDGQLGLLSGLAFALLYAILGLPLARLADRASRKLVLTASLAGWSLFTAATGLSHSFTALFGARVGVGVGEAGCVPSAHSMIGDLFPAHRRALAISVFQAGGVAGLSAGLVLTGLIADRIGWRGAMVVVGLMGLPLALLTLLGLPEPPRRTRTPALAENAVSAIRGLVERPAYVHLMLAIAVGSFGAYGVAQWLPSFLIRVHHLTLSQVGLMSGLPHGAAGVLGALAGGAASARLMKADPRWELWWPALGYGLGGALYALAVFAPTSWTSIALFTGGVLAAASGGGVALSAVQSFAEPHRRATAVALVLFLSSLIGLGGGPLIVGLISDMLRPAAGAGSLRYGLLAAAGSMAWAAVHFACSAASADRDRLARLEMTLIGANP